MTLSVLSGEYNSSCLLSGNWRCIYTRVRALKMFIRSMSGYDINTIKVEMVSDIPVYAMQVRGADLDTLRFMGDQFVQKYTGGTAIFVNEDGKVIAVAGKELVQRGFKAGDLITGIGGKGGGRPNMAQGSLPDPSQTKEALNKVTKVVEEKLK